MLAQDLPEDVRDLGQMTREFARERLAPLIADAEQGKTFVEAIRNELAEAGLFGVVVPSEFGGIDADVRHQMIVLEEIARVYPSACTYLTAHWLASKLVTVAALHDDAPVWAKPLLRRCATGEALGAIAVTEPGAGSDLASVSTRARKSDEGWQIDGTKRFITNGGFADFYVVLARTSDDGAHGTSLFFVPGKSAGVTASRFEDKMGLHGSATAEMVFAGVQVPSDHLIGDVGRGFAYTMKSFNEGRIGVAAMSLGMAGAALDASVLYATQREQFGKLIGSFQGMQFLLADMAIAVEASRSLLYDAAAAQVAGLPQAAALAAVAKTFVTDAAMQVTTDAVQVHGGYGYVTDFPVEMLMRDAKIGQIYEGTNQIQRMLVARALLGDVAR